MNASIQAWLSGVLPIAAIGAVLFALSKWGHAKAWALAVAVLAGVILAGTSLGPPIHAVLSQLSNGVLH
jgi:hypothetical protein